MVVPDYIKPALLLFLVVTISGSVGGCMAANRGRRIVLWCLLCALFPLLILVIHHAKPLVEVEGQFRRCPSCRRLIRWSLTTCSYCGAEIDE